MTARMSYLQQDRSESHSAVKELGRGMSNPNQGSWLKLKKLLRHPKIGPRYKWLFGYQGRESSTVAWSDRDFAGCTKYRKSTSAA